MKKNRFILWSVCIIFLGLTVAYKDKALNKTGESGPIKVSVKGITVGELKVSEENKDIFENKELVTLVTVDMVIENSTDESIWFSPNLATITTDTGEVVDADMLISSLIGDPFIGKHKKEGDIVFILDTLAEEISQLNMVIEGAEDEESAKLGDSIEMSFDIK